MNKSQLCKLQSLCKVQPGIGIRVIPYMFFQAWGIEPRALCMSGKPSIPRLYLQPSVIISLYSQSTWHRSRMAADLMPSQCVLGWRFSLTEECLIVKAFYQETQNYLSDCGHLGCVRDSFRGSFIPISSSVATDLHRRLVSQLQHPFLFPASSFREVHGLSLSGESRRVLLWLDVNDQPAPVAYCCVVELSS